MKLITARINPYRLDSVYAALADLGIENLLAMEVKCFNKAMDHTEVHRGHAYSVHFMPMVKIEVVVTDEMLKTAVDTIHETANPQHSEGESAVHVCDLLDGWTTAS